VKRYEYDVLTIGLGPAGMAVAGMAVEMGLKVAAIEARAIGGECMNVGCIPSKALLRMAQMRHSVKQFPQMELASVETPAVANPFAKIARDLDYINQTKTRRMFERVHLVLGQGEGSFIDPHTVAVGRRRLTARRIFIATGTQPVLPPIPGLEQVEVLTNNTLFKLAAVPESLTIVGGGAIGSEMAQAFSRLGSRVTIVHMDEHLVPAGDPEAGKLLEEMLRREGIEIHHQRRIVRAARESGGAAIYTDRGERILSQQVLVAAGRRVDLAPLRLENAGIAHTPRGITVDRHLRTSRRHIYAVGDCNGHAQLSHAAMHQGMIALINAMMPWPLKRDFRRFVVPWTVFTEPQVSHVGMTHKQLDEKGIRYETITASYEDYGAAIAENIAVGHVKVHTSPAGRIYGVSIVGEGSGEMINEWALAIQNGLRMHHIMLQQHSFPTMGFLSKRAAEMWMVRRMASPRLRALARLFYRRGGGVLEVQPAM
jgi:pyruvate/2-oxoglutarate dehydrogenase complex dihydrolipoamide dehydrogenase (E3) component